VLLELLADPDCPRRDNVVAFLSHLGGEESVGPLLELLEAPPAGVTRPEEDRGLLLAPPALAHIASRGSARAREALESLARGGGAVERGVARGVYGTRMAQDLAEQARGALELLSVAPATAGGDPPAGPIELEPRPRDEPPDRNEPSLIDGATGGHAAPLSFTNHVNAPSPMTNGELDSALRSVSIVAGHEDYPDDTACCTTVEREGTAGTFGQSGDGRDIIDNDTELFGVLQAGPQRVKIVRQINWCSGPGTNIIGCSFLPGRGMVVVRLSTPAGDGALWLHEYGHNAGLDHSSDPRDFMYFAYNGGNSLLSPTECSTFHSPAGQAQISLRSLGACNDNDGDAYVSTADNCPTVSNATQADSDLDRVGTACDNCPAVANTDQADADTDTIGDACDPCVDRDDDGYGSPASAACSVGATLDCNDGSAAVHPGGMEVCDGLDNDCDAGIDNARCEGFDVSADERVDGVELAWMGRAFGACSANPSSQWWGPVNYTGDDCVDGDDLAVLSAAWACTDTAPVCPP
jgi:hypothetical protein